MAVRMNRRLQTDAAPLDELVELVRSGEIRIPTFQRGLRWNQKDVLRLLDSIVKGYPIGNLLLWRRPAEAVSSLRIGALEIDAKATDQALFVVDGQQRLTTLANTLSEEGQSDPRFALAYDVSKQDFVPRSNASPFEIPLPVIFDLSRLLDWYREHPALNDDPELVTRANDVAKLIRQYTVPIYVVDNSDPEVLRDIFDRMNNYGKQLSRAEIFSALHETTTGERIDNDSPTALGNVSNDVHAATGYGVVDQDTILLAMLARRGSDVSRDIRREFSTDISSDETREFPDEGPDLARERLTAAMIRAVHFLQTHAESPHFAFLPYRYLLVVLTRFFSHFPEPSSATLRNLRRWFWRAASLGPELTKGSITQATRALCSRIRPGESEESVKALLAMVGEHPSGSPTVHDFRTNWAATRLLISAMWHERPRRISGIEQGEEYSFSDLLAALGESSTANAQIAYVYPTKDLVVEERSLPGDRVLLPEPAAVMPESALDELWILSLRAADGDAEAEATLASHFVDRKMAAALVDGERGSFVRDRQEALMRALRTFLSRQAEWEYEDTPPLSTLALDEDDRDDPVARAYVAN